MSNSIQEKQVDYTEQITLGSLTVGTSLSTVKTLFLNREQYEISYSYKEKEEESLEVDFASSTLTCLFDNNKQCVGTFLFFDDEVDLIRCIEYCCGTFPVDKAHKSWLVNNCFIRIYIDEQECGLSILPSQKED